MRTPVCFKTPSLDGLQPGYLATVPRFELLKTMVSCALTQKCYSAVSDAVHHLGRAAQLGQHRRLIETLSHQLNDDTLEAIASLSLINHEICAAFSVYFTTLEQAYAWPRDGVVSTPQPLHNHKIVIQMLYHTELRDLLHLDDVMSKPHLDKYGLPSRRSLSHSALEIGNSMIKEAETAKANGTSLPKEKQDRVNLLYRTCTQDWFIQGDYTDTQSHQEFGRLHEVVRTRGTQRSIQQMFEKSGLQHLQEMPSLITRIPATENAIASAFDSLQMSVTLVREELFQMVVDEVIWGQTFAKFSKPVGCCTIGAGGADCPMFRMLDALCGMADMTKQDVLLEELDMRSRHFPPNIRALISALASAPSIRAYVASGRASDKLTLSFRAFQQIMFDLYEMHRKKAMRIVLALRAGQLFTSSGTQKSASPEWHIARTLRSAMDVRFGKIAEDRQLPAFATSTPLITKQDGTVEAACVRFDLSTPMVVGPGDSISVVVQVQPGVSQTRTYSITGIHDEDDKSSLSSGDFHLAKAVSVCCRKAGVVSSYLCSRQEQFPVQFTLHPMPHFRIKGNSRTEQDTYFIVQGGAVGVVVTWLRRQEHLLGKYLLVIGSRDLEMLAYATQLYELVDKFKGNLHLAVALSRARPGDCKHLNERGIEVYCGRVTDYLQSCLLPEAAKTYVCGSSEFGIDVAKCLRRPTKHKHQSQGSRLSPVITSELPNLGLHVASARQQSAAHSTKLPTISRAELAMHNSPGDIWTVINNTVYDISVLATFHPGGEKTLLCRAGLDADDMFNSVHQGSFEADSLLERLAIGTLAVPSEANEKLNNYLDKVVEMQNDLTNMSRFEERPTGSVEQLSKAPPAEAVRGSIDKVVKSWIALIQATDTSDDLAKSLQRSLNNVMDGLDRKLKGLYDTHFDDVQTCALGMREIFDVHDLAVQRIHDEFDAFKARIGEMPSSCKPSDTHAACIIERATFGILQALDCMRI